MPWPRRRRGRGALGEMGHPQMPLEFLPLCRRKPLSVQSPFEEFLHLTCRPSSAKEKGHFETKELKKLLLAAFNRRKCRMQHVARKHFCQRGWWGSTNQVSVSAVSCRRQHQFKPAAAWLHGFGAALWLPGLCGALLSMHSWEKHVTGEAWLKEVTRRKYMVSVAEGEKRPQCLFNKLGWGLAWQCALSRGGAQHHPPGGPGAALHLLESFACRGAL